MPCAKHRAKTNKPVAKQGFWRSVASEAIRRVRMRLEPFPWSPRPNTTKGGAGALAWRMPANWRGDCPHEREGAESSQRASAAAGMNPMPYCVTSYSGRKGPAGGEVSARTEKRWERGTSDRTHNIC